MTEGQASREGAALVRKRPFRYFVVGVLNTAFSLGCYSAALYVGLGVPSASAVALLLGICVSFTTQGMLVFGNPTPLGFVRFLLTWGAMYVVHVGVVMGVVRLGSNPYVGGVVAMFTTTALSYFLLRDFVFRPTVAHE